MSYGSLKRDDNVWKIKAMPHVVLRLKRVFGKLQASFRTEHTLTDTLDTCRDLCWFLQRYQLDISDADKAYLESRSAEHQDRESLVSQILKGAFTPRSFSLTFPPREYQKVAADLALRTRGLLVGDDVGLGKTVTAICALTEPSTRPALIVVFGELDWSPMVHEQCIGRVFRDGQKTKVVAYYLVSSDGCDPIMVDVLGIKRAQVEGVRNPKGSVSEPLETTGERVRALARQYLERNRLGAAGSAVYSLTEARERP